MRHLKTYEKQNIDWLYRDCLNSDYKLMCNFAINNELDPLYQFDYEGRKTSIISNIIFKYLKTYDVQEEFIRLNPGCYKWLLQKDIILEDIKKDFEYVLDTHELGLI